MNDPAKLMTVRRCTWVFSLVFLGTVPLTCCAQHAGDVLISVEQGRLGIVNRVNPADAREFDLHGDGTVFRTDDPGYNTVGFGTLNSGDELSFEVVSPLYAWSSQAWETAEEGDYLRYYNASLPDVRSVTMTGTTVEQPGFLIGRASSLGAIHVHDVFELGKTDGAAPIAGAYAIGKKLVSPNYADSDTFYIVLNNGMSSDLFEEAVEAAELLGDPENVWGDLNSDGLLGVEDIDLLGTAIQRGNTETQFDMNRDNAITPEDYRYWVTELKQTWIGDADLDGRYDSGDMIGVFRAGLYEDQVAQNSTWGTGDWNGDGDFTSSDMIAAFQDGGYEKGPRKGTKLVPEPNSLALLMAALTGVVRFSRCRRQKIYPRA